MNTIEIKTPSDFDNQLNSNELLYVDYWKDHCPNCKMLDLSFSELTHSSVLSNVNVLKVKLEDMGENFFFDHDVRQTPTLVLYKKGKEVARLNGFIPPAKIEETIKQNA